MDMRRRAGFIAIGIGVGTAIGAGLHDVGAGVAIGAAFGLVLMQIASLEEKR